ncbi:MAG: type I restriction enzyme HsdR N-terminal domain-containing protein [Tannerellaceae bacterium]|jgi:predicted type IV restriction endonuclease|nr:type I restriction enzyme HsdR N-terminal domain-containing protein [Tannerellaceae bacterium]
MLPLNLPGFDAKVIRKDGKPVIFDPLRRKYVALTPEEWVRQHFINYLMTERKYPKDLLANEITINLNNTTKRCDTIVYNRFLNPVMVIEYKAPSVMVKKTVFDQIARYNISLRVPYLIVSNGLEHFCCKIDYENQVYDFLGQIPFYDTLDI